MDNTFYVYEIQAMNGQTQGDTSVSDPLLVIFPKTTTESAQTESEGNDGEVTISGGDLVTSDSKPTITVERVDSLVDLGEKWVDQFVKWHEFTFNKWQSAIERYVPYLKKRYSEAQLKDDAAVCPKIITPRRCVQTKRIVDYNGCTLISCTEYKKGLINEADIDDWEEMYLQYENYIYPQYDRLFQLYQQYFDEANAAESR
jgi:hypothetical protein